QLSRRRGRDHRRYRSAVLRGRARQIQEDDRHCAIEGHVMLGEFLQEPRVAYFSMEIALRNEIPTYAGGLGVLAGDTLRSAADLRLPFVGLTLVSRAGYFQQEIDASGRQTERAATWDPAAWTGKLDAKVAVRIEGRPVWIGAWLYIVTSHM